MAACALWIPSKAFAIQFRIPDEDSDTEGGTAELDWDKLHGQFSALNRLSSLINHIFGTVFFLFLLESLLGYGAAIDHFILQRHNPDWQLFMAGVIYFIHCHCVIILTADVSYQVFI